MSLPILHIGNKNYSSWSMRPWLALHWGGIAFEERVIPLGPRGMGLDARIVAINPSGTVPVLELPAGEKIWDTLSICEWAHEQAPTAQLWPDDPIARAIARSATAEMHSGFAAARQALPMNLKRIKNGHDVPAAAQQQIARIDALLTGLQTRFNAGKAGWLFGHPTIVDAFYAPIATRLRTYGVPVSAQLQAWCDHVFADPAFAKWDAAARLETWTIGETDEV